jgi:thioredoxin reductase (NADPH)
MSERIDLIVVGAGPCGIAVGAAAASRGLSCVLFDKGCVAQSLVDYPYYMTFFSTAVMLEIGDVPFTIPDAKPTRRDALAYYRRVVEHRGIDVRQYESVERVEGSEGSYLVRTRKRDGSERTYPADAVVMATGGFHSPNMLDVPGEGLDKVRHYYREPYPYYDQDVLVVGAGNSAVEAALELYRNGARVSLVHFLDTIDRGVKPWVVPDITNRLDRGEITPYWHHRIVEIRHATVRLRHVATGVETDIPNDFVLALTGWKSDSGPLRTLGVSMDADTGIPYHDPTSMETNVPGLYIAGVIAAGHDANKIFIENGREHGTLIVADRLEKRRRT